jgi:hypothetical protein
MAMLRSVVHFSLTTRSGQMERANWAQSYFPDFKSFPGLFQFVTPRGQSEELPQGCGGDLHAVVEVRSPEGRDLQQIGFELLQFGLKFGELGEFFFLIEEVRSLMARKSARCRPVCLSLGSTKSLTAV